MAGKLLVYPHCFLLEHIGLSKSGRITCPRLEETLSSSVRYPRITLPPVSTTLADNRHLEPWVILLYCIILDYCSVQYITALYSTVLILTELHHTLQYGTLLYSTKCLLHITILTYCTVLQYSTVQFCSPFHPSTVMQCILLPYTVKVQHSTELHC